MPDARNKRRWPVTTARDDRHAPAAITRRPATMAGYYHEPDAIELDCCTMEWRDGGWQHERACIAAGRR